MKIVAKCYGVWGCRYYRTESGHTFSTNKTPAETFVFYHGNVITDKNTKMRKLNEEEKTILFEKVEFVD